jgi:hypothetical protein
MDGRQRRFVLERFNGEATMRSWRHAFIWLTAAVLLATSISQPASAGPPGYLVLRRGEAPGNHNRTGYYDAAMYDARTTGYAYGFFGVAPRAHFSRHFGTYRNYTQFARY